MYVVVVDVSGNEEYMDLVRSSIAAVVNGLDPSALFGMEGNLILIVC